MKKYLIIILSLFFGHSVFAQKIKTSLSLKEAIDMALENSYNTKASKNNVLSAKETVWETTATGLPQIDAAVNYQNFIKQPVSLLPAAAFDNTASVVQTVEDYFGIQSNRDPSLPQGFIPVVFGTQQNINASVTVTQLLFDGSYLVGLQASRAYLKISEQANEKTEILTREAVVNAYGSVLVAEKSITILQGNLKIIEKNLHDAKKIYENGFNEQEDVEQLEITFGTLKSQLYNLQRMKGIAYHDIRLIETKQRLSLLACTLKSQIHFFPNTQNPYNYQS